jgi:threonine dehydratase
MINEKDTYKYKNFEYKSEIEKAFKRIEKYIIKTPIVKCFYLSKLLNTNIYIKCEHMQITGSFKLRGAANKIILLKEKGINSIVTASTGNHGSAISYICNLLKINAHIFIPNSCDMAKKEKIINYGGKFVKIHFNENPNCRIKSRRLCK